MEVLKQIFQIIFTPAAILVGLAYFLRKYFDLSFTKDLERFKQDIEAEAEQNKLRLEKELEIKLFEYQTRFSQFYQKYSQNIAELYKRLVIAEQLMRNLPIAVGEHKKEQADRAGDAFVAFSDFFNEHRIYFNKDICTKVDFIIDILGKTYIHFVIARLPNEESLVPQPKHITDEHLEKLTDMWLKIKDEIPSIKESLEDQFRESLIVSISPNINNSKEKSTE